MLLRDTHRCCCSAACCCNCASSCFASAAFDGGCSPGLRSTRCSACIRSAAACCAALCSCCALVTRCATSSIEALTAASCSCSCSLRLCSSCRHITRQHAHVNVSTVTADNFQSGNLQPNPDQEQQGRFVINASASTCSNKPRNPLTSVHNTSKPSHLQLPDASRVVREQHRSLPHCGPAAIAASGAAASARL